ncbi:IS630 family transposase, partial [Pleurocapsa sp. PCC 7319]
MIQIEFSEEEIQQLNYERYHHPHPRVQKKMEVLYLKSRRLSHQEIRRLCQISKTTLVSYVRQYQQGGIEQLKQLNYKGKPSQLNEQVKTIEVYFQEHPPRKVAEAQAKIEELTGIKRNPTQIRAFLYRIGMGCRKVGFVPGKGSDPDKIEEQENFRQQKLEPLLEEAKAGKKAVFFVDAAHFVHRAYLGFIWCFTRIFMRSPSGRKRFNVLGAINAVTKEVVSVTNETYINAETVCELLVHLSELDLDIPITLVLDNARYQKCRFVKDVAGFLGIELLYLPSYSPHLNLIERLWRFVRHECLYS